MNDTEHRPSHTEHNVTDTMQVLSQIHGHESLIFGHPEDYHAAIVYLHDSSGFKRGATGQFLNQGFAVQLLRHEISLPIPFITACAMQSDAYDINALKKYIVTIKKHYALTDIHIVALGRGGQAAYQLLESKAEISTATIINSALPQAIPSTAKPIHIIYSLHNETINAQQVKQFYLHAPAHITLTEWADDHDSIAGIAKSGVVLDWIGKNQNF